MWKKITIILFYLIACFLIYEKESIISTNTISSTLKEKLTIPKFQEKPIGKLIINKINLIEDIYSIDSKHNNIEEHVTILPPSKEPEQKNTTIFIAAHSGTGRIAYFKNLNNLSINDQIILIYKNISYKYIVKNIWEEKKTGTITIPKENTNQLILTTCSPTKDGYQLIINCLIT